MSDCPCHGVPPYCSYCVAYFKQKQEKQMQEQEQFREIALQFFNYDHLPEGLQYVSKPFKEMAEKILNDSPANPERSAALRKLLEAKDCAVRARIYKP